jgi:hypothetical protein
MNVKSNVTLVLVGSVMALFLCINLAVPPGLMAQGTKEETAKQEGPAFRPEEIDQIMAPIALYPDSESLIELGRPE